MLGEIQYYNEIKYDSAKQILPGRFCITPVSYLLARKITYCCCFDYFTNASPGNYSLKTRTDEITNLLPERFTSFTQIGIDEGTFLPLNPYKLRSVIVLFNPIPNIRDHKIEDGDIYLVVPMYSLRDAKNSNRFSEKFTTYLQAYKYPSLFYLPEDEDLGVHESMVRFDRIMVTKSDCIKPKPIQLTEDAYYCLYKWLLYFLGCELDEMIAEYRNAALESLNKPHET